MYKRHAARFARLAEVLWDIREGSDEEKALAGIRAFEAYFREIGMPTRMRELGIGEEAFRPMAEKCTANGTKILSAIEDYDTDKIVEVFRLADAAD